MTDNETPKQAKSALKPIHWILVGAIAVVSLLLGNLIAGVYFEASKPRNNPDQVEINPSLMGGKCEQVLTKTNAVLDLIGIDGSPGSSEEIDNVLKESGEYLTSLSSSDLDGLANKKLVHSAGQSMLNILEYFNGNSTEADLETNGNLLADSYNSMTSICSGKSTAEPVDLPLSGECDNVTRYLDRAIQAMGGAGTTLTTEEVMTSLKENGEMLTKGFDAQILGGRENWDLVRGAGEDLLRIRVGISDNGDIKNASDDFKKRYKDIQTICTQE